MAHPLWPYRLLNSLLLLMSVGVLLEKVNGATEKYFPQAIRGDALNTTRILVWNLGSSAAAVTLQFFNQTGEQLESRIILLEGNGSQEVTLGACRTFGVSPLFSTTVIF